MALLNLAGIAVLVLLGTVAVYVSARRTMTSWKHLKQEGRKADLKLSTERTHAP